MIAYGVDMDDVRAELELLYRKTEEMLAEEEDETLRAMHLGTLIGYAKVEVPPTMKSR